MTKKVKQRLFTIILPSFVIGLCVWLLITYISNTYPDLLAYRLVLSFVTTIFFLTLFFALMAWRNSKMTELRHSEDVSHWETPIPNNKSLIAQRLEVLGFSLLGLLRIEESAQLDGMPDAWLYVDKQGFIQALITSMTNPVLITVFEDGFLVATTYSPPPDTYLDADGYQPSSKSYDTHQGKIDRAVAEHGQPQHIRSIDDYLYWERTYGAENRSRRLRKVATICGGMTIFVASLILQIFIMILAIFQPVPQILQDNWLIPAIVAVLIIVVFYITGVIEFHAPRKSDKSRV